MVDDVEDLAISAIVDELERIHLVKKCTGCECFLGVLEAVARALGESKAPAGRRLRGLLDPGQQLRHSCLGCPVCYPAEPYNRFTELHALQLEQPGVALRVMR